jgi:hypothetical protein
MGLYFRGEPGEADRSLIAGELGRPEDQQMLAEGAAELVREHGTKKASGAVPLALGVSLAAAPGLPGSACASPRWKRPAGDERSPA